MRFKATLLLSAALLAVYFAFSGGTPYLPTEFLEGFALGGASAAGAVGTVGAAGAAYGLFTHVFLHVGIQHLVGNLLPLVAFALLLETVLAAGDVIAVFLAAGVFGGALFALFNPGSALVGASAAISGLMAAGAALKPKRALALLVCVPLGVAFVAVPLVDFGERAFEEGLFERKIALEQEVSTLLAQNKTAEARAANASLQAVAVQTTQTIEGKEREAETPTDFAVHAFGAFAGVAFLWVFRREKLRTGLAEYADLGESIFSFFARVKRRVFPTRAVRQKKK